MKKNIFRMILMPVMILVIIISIFGLYHLVNLYISLFDGKTIFSKDLTLKSVILSEEITFENNKNNFIVLEVDLVCPEKFFHFPYKLVFLDQNNRIVKTVESDFTSHNTKMRYNVISNYSSETGFKRLKFYTPIYKIEDWLKIKIHFEMYEDKTYHAELTAGKLKVKENDKEFEVKNVIIGAPVSLLGLMILGALILLFIKPQLLMGDFIK